MKQLFLNDVEADFLAVMLQRYFDDFCEIDKGAARRILEQLKAK